MTTLPAGAWTSIAWTRTDIGWFRLAMSETGPSSGELPSST
ncbi:hypothetical protein [Streptomyces wuyuanensis]